MLGCNDKTMAIVKRDLSKSGFIVTGRGSSKKNKQRIGLSQREGARGLMEAKYFEPTIGISHHVRLSYSH
jgi:hypothetical protein